MCPTIQMKASASFDDSFHSKIFSRMVRKLLQPGCVLSGSHKSPASFSQACRIYRKMLRCTSLNEAPMPALFILHTCKKKHASSTQKHGHDLLSIATMLAVSHMSFLGRIFWSKNFIDALPVTSRPSLPVNSLVPVRTYQLAFMQVLTFPYCAHMV